MYCKKCGTEIVGQSMYCKHCGAKVSHRPKYILVSVMAIIVIVGICLGYTYMNPVMQFMKSIENEDVYVASKIYDEHISGKGGQEEKTEEKLEKYIEKQKKLFSEQKASFDEVFSKLLVVDKTDIIDEKVYDVIEEVKHIQLCRELFKSAEEAAAEGDYFTAISLYTEVVGEEFENGEVAIERLAEVTTIYRNEILEEAKSFIEDNEFETAIAKFDKALKILPDDAELQVAKENCLKNKYDYTIQTISNEISGLIEKKDYTTAISNLNEYIAEYPEENKLQDLMKKCLEHYKTYVLEETQKLITSKAFKEALVMIDNALEVYEDEELDKVRAQAVATYESSVINEAEKYVQAGDYVSAKGVLNEGVNYIGKTESLNNKIQEIDERQVMTQAVAYAETNKYMEAIMYLNKNSTIVSASSDLQTKLNAYTEKYRNDVISEAENSYKTGGYTAAISVLNAALGVLPDDKFIDEEKARYEAIIPIDLIDLDVTKQGEQFRVGKYYGCDFSKDVNGETYTFNGVHYLYDYEEGDASEHTITYNLNQKYDVLTGVLYRPYITLSCWFDWEQPGKVEIYGDGVLLYEASISQDSYDAITFTVDVTGVRELKIYIGGIWRSEYMDWGAYTWYPKVCLAELQVAKDIK